MSAACDATALLLFNLQSEDVIIMVLKPHSFVDIDNATLYLVPVYTKHACIHAESDVAMSGSLD